MFFFLYASVFLFDGELKRRKGKKQPKMGRHSNSTTNVFFFFWNRSNLVIITTPTPSPNPKKRKNDNEIEPLQKFPKPDLVPSPRAPKSIYYASQL